MQIYDFINVTGATVRTQRFHPSNNNVAGLRIFMQIHILVDAKRGN